MADGTLTLHRFNGREVYGLKSATADLYRRGNTSVLVLTAQGRVELLETCPDTADEPTEPEAEVAIDIGTDTLDAIVGRRYSVPLALDEESGEWVGRLYYYEHEDLNDNKVEVLARTQAGLRVRWTATCRDVNYYNGSKPDTRVEIEGVFELK